jgi:hypothetical protein
MTVVQKRHGVRSKLVERSVCRLPHGVDEKLFSGLWCRGWDEAAPALASHHYIQLQLVERSCVCESARTHVIVRRSCEDEDNHVAFWSHRCLGMTRKELSSFGERLPDDLFDTIRRVVWFDVEGVSLAIQSIDDEIPGPLSGAQDR